MTYRGSTGALARSALICIASLGGTIALLAGCSAGQVAQTAVKQSSIQGENANVGPIAMRDARIVASENVDWAQDSDVPLSLTLINQGTAPDTLVTVESPDAEAVVFVAGEYADQRDPGQSPAEPTLEPTGTPSPSPTPTATPSDDAELSIPLQAGEIVALTGVESAAHEAQYLLLQNVRRQITPGDMVSVTFTFEYAGPITLHLRVAPPTKPRPREPLQYDNSDREHH